MLKLPTVASRFTFAFFTLLITLITTLTHHLLPFHLTSISVFNPPCFNMAWYWPLSKLWGGKAAAAKADGRAESSAAKSDLTHARKSVSSIVNNTAGYIIFPLCFNDPKLIVVIVLPKMIPRQLVTVSKPLRKGSRMQLSRQLRIQCTTLSQRSMLRLRS